MKQKLTFPPLEEIVRALTDDELTGFCLACGEEAFNVEPDARRYPCECCDARQVYGAQELLFMVGA